MAKIAGKKKKETLQIARRLLANLPMLVPLEQIKVNVVDVWTTRTDKDEMEKWGVMFRCSRQWADGLITYEIMLPVDLLRRVMIPGPLSRRILLVLTDWARERKTLELEFTKQELLKALGYTAERLKKGGEIFELVYHSLSIWKRVNIQVEMGKGKYWRDFKKWEGSPIDALGWKIRDKYKGAKLYVRLNKEFFGDPQYIKLPIDRLTESLSRDETYFLDYVDSLLGFPVNTIKVRRLFTEKLGYSLRYLKKRGGKEIKQRLYRILETAKEKGRLRKPGWKIDTKDDENVLNWNVKLYLGRKETETNKLKKEIVAWHHKPEFKTRMLDTIIQRLVGAAIKRWSVKWVRETFEWCVREGKHTKDFWETIKEGPDFYELEEIREQRKQEEKKNL